MALMDSIAATKARVDKLKRVADEQKSRKDEYAEIISQQSKGSFYLLEFVLVFIYKYFWKFTKTTVSKYKI